MLITLLKIIAVALVVISVMSVIIMVLVAVAATNYDNHYYGNLPQEEREAHRKSLGK